MSGDVFQHTEDLPGYRESNLSEREHAELLAEAEQFVQSKLYQHLVIEAAEDEKSAIESLIDAKDDAEAEQARKEIHRCRHFARWAERLLDDLEDSQKDADPPY